jgi:hypothetical protein
MIDAKDWPLELEDHVVLEHEIDIDTGTGASLNIPIGTHGVVKKIEKFQTTYVFVEFRGMLFRMKAAQAQLSLYRRSQHSKRRADHDARRPKPKKA